MSDWKYYVYELIDPRNGEVFYVGKGSGKRAYKHERAVMNGNRESLLFNSEIIGHE